MILSKSKKLPENVSVRGIRIKLLPTQQQEILLTQFIGTRRFAYDWALELRTNTWVNENRFIPLSELLHMFTLLRKDDDTLWLNDISCDVGKQAIKDLDVAFQRYFKMTKEPGYVIYTKNTIRKAAFNHRDLTIYDRNGYPKFKKRYECNEGFHVDCYKLQLKEDQAYIPKIGWIKLAISNKLPIGKAGYDFKAYNVKVKTDGLNWFLVLGLEKEISNTSYIPKTEPIGIDLGIKDLAILSDNTKYKNINKTKRVKQLKKRIRRLERQLSRKYQMNKQGDKYVKTNNILKLKRKLLKLQHQLTNIRKNYRHQITSELVKREPIFISIEDLNVKGMMKNKHLSKATQEQGFYEFRLFLTYKCKEHGIPLYLTDRFFPSSKTCSCCGYKNKDLKLSDRIYKCPNCNTVIDRDINAAVNIRNYGQELHNKSIIQIL